MLINIKIGFNFKILDASLDHLVVRQLSANIYSTLNVCRTLNSEYMSVVKVIHTSGVYQDKIDEYEKSCNIVGRNRQYLLGSEIFRFAEYDSIIVLQQYYENGSIENYDLSNSNDLSSQLSLLIDISNALRELSELLLCHINLKPSNLILNNDGHLFISDYCKAFLYLNNPNISINSKTYEYLSPEIIKCETYNESSDIWSYGCLIYYIYYGMSPFYNSSLYKMLNNIVMVEYRIVENELHENVNNLIKQMLKIDSSDRMNIGSIITELNRIISQSFNQNTTMNVSEINNILNEGKCLTYNQLEEIGQMQNILINIINLYNSTKESKYFYVLVNICLMYNNDNYLKKYITSKMKCESQSIDSKILNGINEGYTLYLVWKDITFENIVNLFNSFYYLSILRGLYLYNIIITDEGIKHLCDNLKHLPELLGLYLYNNEITSKGVKLLSNYLFNISKLQELAIQSVNIGDEGVKYISQNLKYLPTLKELYLTNDCISNDGVEYIIENISVCNSLEKLTLSGNNIKDITLIKKIQCNINHVINILF